MNTLVEKVLDKIKDRVDADCENGNIGTSERILSVISGGFIVGFGFRKLIKSPLTAISGLSLGGALLYRGITGHCVIKEAVDKAADAGEDPKKDEIEVIERHYIVK